MQFYDRAKIYVKAGDGGNGSLHFRREKFAPLGGPDGGDGGRGGSIYLTADPSMGTLVDFHYQQKYKADAGVGGGGQKMHGAKGKDLVLRVPAGTLVREVGSGAVLGDLTEGGEQIMVARGGRGGLGNVHFATATNQAPREAQRGEPGEDRWIELELKLIADVGLVGYPNAGKSTLLSVISNARPKIASYPFTTLIPNLGVAVVGDPTRGDDFSYVVADIPGLIEGAAQGVGLGHEFLRHVERCRLLLHLIDGGDAEREPWEEFEAINKELAEYSEHLAGLPQIVVLTKMDLPEAQERWEVVQKRAEAAGLPAIAISSATQDGVRDLMNLAAQTLLRLREDEAYAQKQRAAVELPAGGPILRPIPEDAFDIEKTDDGFNVRGRRVERAVAMTDPESVEGMERLENTLRKMGVFSALEKRGVRPGDVISFGKSALTWGDEGFGEGDEEE